MTCPTAANNIVMSSICCCLQSVEGRERHLDEEIDWSPQSCRHVGRGLMKCPNNVQNLVPLQQIEKQGFSWVRCKCDLSTAVNNIVM